MSDRHVRTLGISFGIAWVALSMVVGPGPAAWVKLSGRLADAGLFFALYGVSAALGAFAGGRLMDRVGRRRVLIAAHVTASAGFATAGLGYFAGGLALFAAGVVLLAVGFGAVFLTRLAAIDHATADRRGRAVAVVQVSATFGAIAGPLLLVAADPASATIGRDARDLVWLVGPLVLLASAFVASLVPEPPRAASQAPPAASPPRAAASAPLAAGIVAIALAEASMVGVMGVTGAALAHEGHGIGATGIVMVAHFLGMFGLSLLVGRVPDHLGRRPTIVAGLVVLAAGGLVVGLTDGVAAFAFGLLLVGLGWSFAYIGATVLVTDVAPPDRRASLLGTTDFATRLLSASVSAAAGWWYASRGLSGLGLAAAAVALVPIVLVLSVRETRPAPV